MAKVKELEKAIAAEAEREEEEVSLEDAIDIQEWDIEASIKRFEFKIEGLAPGMLMNNPEFAEHFQPEKDVVLKNGKIERQKIHQGLKTNQQLTLAEEMTLRLYRNKEGQIYVPALWVRNAIYDSAKGKKHVMLTNAGSKKVYTRPCIATGLMVADKEEFIVTRNGEPLTTFDRIDQRRGVNRQSKPPVGILCQRPQIEPPWVVEGYLDYYIEAIPPMVLEQLLECAGKFNGLGDFTPRNGKGWFGRFRVVWTNVG